MKTRAPGRARVPPLALALASAVAPAFAMVLAAVAWPRPAAADAERKLAVGKIAVVKCSDDAGKATCGKGIKEIAATLEAKLKDRLKESSVACGAGKKETATLLFFWDNDEGAPAADKTTKLDTLPACLRTGLVPALQEDWPPIHFAAKAKDAAVEMRYWLKIPVTLE
ncbi:MAG TPA: hypothetical protein VG389_09840 [Myxococcota bacterium]|nr:hypothetical protein [Myxococcota bacterium]